MEQLSLVLYTLVLTTAFLFLLKIVVLRTIISFIYDVIIQCHSYYFFYSHTRPDFPKIPLHNNGSEIAVREGVLKRKISYGTRSELGKAAWENMLSILDTCRKQKVNFYMYIKDIYSNSFSMPRLADMIPKVG
jgi:hypothetical protein